MSVAELPHTEAKSSIEPLPMRWGGAPAVSTCEIPDCPTASAFPAPSAPTACSSVGSAFASGVHFWPS